MHRNWQSTSNKKKKRKRREQYLPLCCRTLGWKSRLLRDFPSFFDVHRSFSAVILDVVIVVTAGIVVVVAAGVVAVVGRHVSAIAGKRHRWRGIVDVRRPRMDRERRSLWPRSAASDRAPGTDAPLGPRWRRVIVRLENSRRYYCVCIVLARGQGEVPGDTSIGREQRSLVVYVSLRATSQARRVGDSAWNTETNWMFN